jgi:formate-dependent nitrite reductase membrane component NrfD
VPDTFWTTSPDWTWWIVPYFFIGGIAGGALFLAALLRLFGRPSDRPIIRIATYVALVGVMLSGPLLIFDLDRPERFWHMLIESETGQPMFKWWSPMSVGSWGVLLFGVFAFLAALGSLYESDRMRWRPFGWFANGAPATVVAVLGGLFGFFLAGYTGVLLAVSNRPIWADSTWLGVLFLFSAGSTAAATLILLGLRRRTVSASSLEYLSTFDKAALVLELIALVIFLVSLGGAIQYFLMGWGIFWGLVLILGVVVLGILLPLAISAGRVRQFSNRLAASAWLVLLGGLLLRMSVLFASHGYEKPPTILGAP